MSSSAINEQRPSTPNNENINPSDLAPSLRSPSKFDHHRRNSTLSAVMHNTNIAAGLPNNVPDTKSMPIPRTPKRRNANFSNQNTASPNSRSISRIKHKPNIALSPSKSSPLISSPTKRNNLISSPGRSPSRSSVQLYGSQLNSPAQNSISNVNISSVGNGTANTNGIKVLARFRPQSEKEALADLNENANDYEESRGIIDFQSDTSVVYDFNDQHASFTFDRVFPPSSTQKDIYEYCINETVNDVFQGYNGTILAYGQTGSGKTYTMMGSDIEDKQTRGLIPRIADAIFELIMLSSSDIEYTVGVSYMEIYMEKIRDLLDSSTDSNNLQIHEDKDNGIHVKGLQTLYATTPADLYNIMKEGSNSRAIASTNMNEESSRSHAIFQIVITQKTLSTGVVKKGNLFLVDLAGSEKVAKTGASGQTLEEAKKINSSLSSLGNVINALTDGKSHHIPYRDSKLTRILQESLGGNSRTSLIINCSPSKTNAFETLSTLRFGSRAKKIKNKAHINTELSPKELKRNLVKLTKTKQKNEKLISELMNELLLWRKGLPPKQEEWVDFGLNQDADFANSTELLANINDDGNFSSNNNQKGNISEDIGDLSDVTFEDFAHLNDTILSNDSGLAKENQTLKNEIAKSRKIISMHNLEKFKLDEFDEKVSLLESLHKEIEYLKSQLEIEKLANASLISNLKEKTTKCANLDLEVESLKGQLRKKALTRNEKQRIMALEKSLESFAHKLEDMALQNNILKKDIVTTRKIAETRNERIRTLEAVVKDKQLEAQSESTSFEAKLNLLKERLSAIKKLGEDSRPFTVTSPVSDSKFNYSSFVSPKTSLIPLETTKFMTPEIFHETEVSPTILQHDAFESDAERENLNPLRLSVASPDMNDSKKKGLNFRIVKPLRGGNGTPLPAINDDKQDASGKQLASPKLT